VEPEVNAAPAPEAAAPAADDKTTSLDDHAALFGPPDPSLDAEAKAKNDEARAKVRHRAKSQQASPEDAPRIAELTRKLRETEAERDALKKPAPIPPARVDPPLGTVVAPTADGAVAARQAALPPTREKPSVDRIGIEGGYDTYEAYVEDLADWRFEQREAERDAKQQQAQQARQQAEAQQTWAKAHATYAERLTAFKADHADFDALLAQHGAIQLPGPVIEAILASEHGPAWSYHLMSHPEQLEDIALLFEGKAHTPDMVARATRWLSSRAQVVAAPVAAPALALAPKPPNPVRSGAAKTDTEGPGDDSMSIEAHEKAYGRGRRR
jgi:hypothetical protein